MNKITARKGERNFRLCVYIYIARRRISGERCQFCAPPVFRAREHRREGEKKKERWKSFETGMFKLSARVILAEIARAQPYSIAIHIQIYILHTSARKVGVEVCGGGGGGDGLNDARYKSECGQAFQ